MIPPLSPRNTKLRGSLKSPTHKAASLSPWYALHRSISTHSSLTAHRNLLHLVSTALDPTHITRFPHPEAIKFYPDGHGVSGSGRCAILTFSERDAGFLTLILLDLLHARRTLSIMQQI